jgi:hypothetical protein
MRSFAFVTVVLVLVGLTAGTTTARADDPPARIANCESLYGSIRLTQERIASLRRQLAGEEPIFGAKATDNLYQNLKFQLSEAEIDLATLKTRWTSQQCDDPTANCEWPEDLVKQAKLHWMAIEALNAEMRVEHHDRYADVIEIQQHLDTLVKQACAAQRAKFDGQQKSPH